MVQINISSVFDRFPSFGSLLDRFEHFWNNWLRVMSASSLVLSSLLFKLLAFLRKWTSFIDQKCTCEKVTKILGRAPLFIWTKSKRKATCFRETFPKSSNKYVRKLLCQRLKSQILFPKKAQFCTQALNFTPLTRCKGEVPNSKSWIVSTGYVANFNCTWPRLLMTTV